MPNLKPHYFNTKPLINKPDTYYWYPSPSIRKYGWKQIIFFTDNLHSTKYIAMQQADWVNAILFAWRNQDMIEAQKILDLWADGQTYQYTLKNGRLKKLEITPITTLTIPSLTLKNNPAQQTFKTLIENYYKSSNFDVLKPKTQKDYKNHIDNFPKTLFYVENSKRQVPVTSITKAVGKKYYEKTYTNISPNTAKARLTVLKLLLSYAVDIGWLNHNPLEKMRMRASKPRVVTWENDEILEFVKQAKLLNVPSIGDMVILACHTSLRQTDLMGIKEHHYQPQNNQNQRASILVNIDKTGNIVNIPLTSLAMQSVQNLIERNKAHIAKYNVIPAEVPLIISERTLGRHNSIYPWKQKSFNTWFNKVKAKVTKTHPQFKDKKFQDLRDTGLTLLAKADVNKFGIASVSGHSFGSVDSVLKHYIDLNGKMANEAITKLENHLGDKVIK